MKAIEEDALLPFWQWFARNVAAPLERDRKVGADRHFQLPWIVPQVAGFRRAPVQIKALKKAIWQWFARNVAAPLARDRKVQARLALVSLNPKPETRKPEL